MKATKDLLIQLRERYRLITRKSVAGKYMSTHIHTNTMICAAIEGRHLSDQELIVFKSWLLETYGEDFSSIKNAVLKYARPKNTYKWHTEEDIKYIEIQFKRDAQVALNEK